MKKLVRDRHNCGKGYVWYILDTETGERINTFYSAYPSKDCFRRVLAEKILKESLN